MNACYGNSKIGKLLAERFPLTPDEETVDARLQARWDANPRDPIFKFEWADGTIGYVSRPMDPSIGSDCLAWRKKIVKGEPLFKRSEPAGASPNWGRKLQPVHTVWRWSPPTFHFDPLDKMKRIQNKGTGHWEHDAARQADVPIRVRCPECKRPIRLSRWWEHGCPNPLVGREVVLGDFYELTKGAKAPAYDGDTEPASAPAVELDAPVAPAPAPAPPIMTGSTVDWAARRRAAIFAPSAPAESPSDDFREGAAIWGTYITDAGERATMYRRFYCGARQVRFYTDEGRWVGPEQGNIAPATAYALAHGWRRLSSPPMNAPPAPTPEPKAARSRPGLTPERASELRRRALAGERPKMLMAEYGISSRGYFYKLKAGRGRTRWAEAA